WLRLIFLLSLPFHLRLLYVDVTHSHKQDKENRHVNDLLIQLLGFQSKRLLDNRIAVSLFYKLLALSALFAVLLIVVCITLRHLLLIYSDVLTFLSLQDRKSTRLNSSHVSF